ncbi:MAG: signal peptidase [Aeromicrobium sp.]|nr:signal peptidase [Aeromicrobium sp.]
MATIAIAVFNVTPIVIRSDSMSPAIDRGDLEIARTQSAGDVSVGDIVSLTNRAGDRVTHRVVTADPFGSSIQFTLKGDANAVPDAEVYNETTVDKVIWSAPKLGYPMSIAIGPVGILIGGLLVGSLGYAIFDKRRRVHEERMNG